MSVTLDVVEDGRMLESLEAEPDAGGFEELEVGAGPVKCLPIYAQEAPHSESQPRGSQRAVGRRTPQAPASDVVRGEVSGCGPHDHKVDLIDRVERWRAVYSARFQPISPWSQAVFFYELREGDDDIFADVLLVREEEMDAEAFFELVQSIRRRIGDSFERDTLIEAIAEELEQDYQFIPISDERLTASVNVSKQEDDNYLASLDSDDDDDGPDYRGIFLEFPNSDGRPN